MKKTKNSCFVLDPSVVTNWDKLSSFFQEQITETWEKHLDSCKVHGAKK